MVGENFRKTNDGCCIKRQNGLEWRELAEGRTIKILGII